MSLGIHTNVSSMSATRALHSASKELETSMERLSTGKQINRAGDDAAGLAIAQRMEAQKRGLETAVKHANEGMAMPRQESARNSSQKVAIILKIIPKSSGVLESSFRFSWIFEIFDIF